jgi:hypothetical protein
MESSSDLKIMRHYFNGFDRSQLTIFVGLVFKRSKKNTQPKGWPLVLFGQQKVPQKLTTLTRPAARSVQ